MQLRTASHIVMPVLILLALVSFACQGQTPPINEITQPAEAGQEPPSGSPAQPVVISLPPPDLDGPMSLEQTLAGRRSVREFRDQPLTPSQIGQLLWAAQGITDPAGYRTAPSAGALYPLEIYAATEDGLFLYNPRAHSLTQTMVSDPRPAICKAALEQESICEAPLVILITAVYERTAVKYGETRSPRYVHLEAGHAAQNILLQAVSLGLGAVPIGAFSEELLSDALNLPGEHSPLYLVAVGNKQ